MIKIRLFFGEQDGKTFDLPDDLQDLFCLDVFEPDNPPIYIWVVPVLAERELAGCRGKARREMHKRHTTCAYRFTDGTADADGEVLELHYERDVKADRTINS